MLIAAARARPLLDRGVLPSLDQSVWDLYCPSASQLPCHARTLRDDLVRGHWSDHREALELAVESLFAIYHFRRIWLPPR
jgi:hypothetical protein